MKGLSRACAGVAVVVAGYYHGEVVMRSADGSRELGRTVAVVKRLVEPAKGRITETVLHAGKDGGPAEERVAVLQRGSGNDFSASDPERSWSGTVRFSGSGWDLPRWTYDLRFKDGSRLAGTGFLDSDGLKTEKTLYDSSGMPSIELREDLRAIGADEYRDLRARLLAGRR